VAGDGLTKYRGRDDADGRVVRVRLSGAGRALEGPVVVFLGSAANTGITGQVIGVTGGVS
jgi:hypothetical protein